MSFKIEYSESYNDFCKVHDALYEYNLSRTGTARQEVAAKKIDSSAAYIVRAENGDILGGVAWHWLTDEEKTVFVDYMFLDPALRGSGMGRKVFETMEEHVRKAGAVRVKVTTNTFQAPQFYLSMGYKVIGSKAEPQVLVPDNVHYTYCKDL